MKQTSSHFNRTLLLRELLGKTLSKKGSIKANSTFSFLFIDNAMFTVLNY